MNFVILMLIFTLSHKISSPPKRNMEKISSESKNYGDEGGSSKKPMLTLEQREPTEHDLNICVERVREVFIGESYIDHIKQAMTNFTIRDNVMCNNVYASGYYRSLENYLEKGDVLPAKQYCIQGIYLAQNSSQCTRTITNAFGAYAKIAVKTIFIHNTVASVETLNNQILNEYIKHVMENYTINENRSTTPEAFCSSYRPPPAH